MKYKVGDKVKIRKDLILGERYGRCLFVATMKYMRGKTATIKEINDGYYKLKEDERGWDWSDEMIEGLAEFTKSDLKDNHIVVYENGLKEIWGKNTNKSILKEDLTRSHKMYTEVIEVWEFDKLVWKREEQILDEVIEEPKEVKLPDKLEGILLEKDGNITVEIASRYYKAINQIIDYLEAKEGE